MNYYERHIGDIAKDCGHLSMIEDGAYARLMDLYYSREKGIPKDEVERLGRAKNKWEKIALQNVIRDFFSFDGAVYKQKRCEKEIRKYRKKQKISRENGALGGRPRNPRKPSDNPAGYSRVSPQTPTPSNQSPITSNQSPSGNTHPPIPLSRAITPTHPRGGDFQKGSGSGRAGRMPTPEDVRGFFDDMDADAVKAMPGAAAQKACVFVGLNPKTAAKAVNRSDITPDRFIREYTGVYGDPEVINPLGALASRLQLSNGKRRAAR